MMNDDRYYLSGTPLCGTGTVDEAGRFCCSFQAILVDQFICVFVIHVEMQVILILSIIFIASMARGSPILDGNGNGYNDDNVETRGTRESVASAKDINAYQNDTDARSGRTEKRVVEAKQSTVGNKNSWIMKVEEEPAVLSGDHFSGVYEPNMSPEALEMYSGAWLASVSLFQELRPRLDTIKDLEGASFFIVDQTCLKNKVFYIDKPSAEMCVVLARTRTVVTRDYFDFQLEHMSSTTKYLEPKNYPLLLPNLRKHANLLAHLGKYKLEAGTRLAKYTLAVIPVSVNPIAYHRNPEMYEMATRVRFNMFKATLWSIYRRIPRIIVSYTNDVGKKWIERYSDFIWKSIDLSAHADEPLLQPKRTLQYVSDLLRKDSLLASQIKYIYYSEADEILHIRQSDQILDVIDKSAGSFVFSPHRLESYFLPQSLAPKQRKQLKEYRFMKQSSLRYHANTSLLVLEPGGATTGSCCDAGRKYFARAPDEFSSEWMFAAEWGLRNVSTWVRFGRYGISMPLMTEHKAVCDYSKTTIRCPIPPDCSRRVPRGSDISSVCKEIVRDYTS